jgi:hypothetical protein
VRSLSFLIIPNGSDTFIGGEDIAYLYEELHGVLPREEVKKVVIFCHSQGGLHVGVSFMEAGTFSLQTDLHCRHPTLGHPPPRLDAQTRDLPLCFVSSTVVFGMAKVFFRASNNAMSPNRNPEGVADKIRKPIVGLYERAPVAFFPFYKLTPP